MYSIPGADLSQMIETLTNDYRIAAVKYIEYLSQAQRSNAKATLHEIQSIFTEDKTWSSEEEMLNDMAKFRRKRLSKCAY